jgi:hypothetical protein
MKGILPPILSASKSIKPKKKSKAPNKIRIFPSD